MIIAFSFLTPEKSEDDENFIHETFDRITKSHLEHTFLFICDNCYKGSLIFSENVIPVTIDRKVKNLIKWLIWFNLKVRKILKKHKADVFISGKFCSLITKVPQILIAPDLGFIHQPSFLNKKQRFFYKKFTPLFLQKAKTIITFSQFEKAGIIKEYKTDPDKIEVIYEGVNENFEPINTGEREIIKEKYADGNEYFIYAGIISPQKNLINLLKAFSAFKKRQRSSMQLIIAGNRGKQFEELKGSLNLYKFKKEINLLEGLSQQDLVKIMASSYAMVYPSPYEISAGTLLNAMKSEVPVITSSTSAIPETCGEAALYFNPENYKDIAEKMMMVFKDEKLRKELIEKGNTQVQKYNWEKSADTFWQLIEKTSVTQI